MLFSSCGAFRINTFIYFSFVLLYFVYEIYIVSFTYEETDFYIYNSSFSHMTSVVV